MYSRVITKNIEVEERKFSVKKFTAMDGLKIAKLIIAKIIPVFQDFVPIVKTFTKSKPSISADGENSEVNGNEATVDEETALEMLGNISLDTIALALDKITGDDLDYIIKKSLQSISEVLPAGENPVMYSNGTYGVEGIEYDPILVLRLTCEAIMWSCGDFFAENRLSSVMKPLFGG